MYNKITSKWKIVIAFFLGIIVAVSGILITISVGDFIVVRGDSKGVIKSISKEYINLPKILNIVKTKSIFEFNESKAKDAALKAIVDALGDEYSEYLTASETKEWEEALNGEFSGVGLRFGKNEEGKYVIGEVFENSPASKSGIKAGDIILKVDGKIYDDTEKMSNHIRGENGTKVNLTILSGEEKKELTLVRETVKEKTVLGKIMDDNIGYIRISSFEDGTAKEFKKQLKSLEEKNIKKMILDLRGNGGGYTNEGIEIADTLLKEGTITYMEDVKGKKEYFNSDVKATKIKYVLLVDEKTASTSEILTAAIKDNQGGKIVGTKTFGKGIVQETMKFADGSSLKLTVMNYYSPKGNVIHKKGIEPDFKVELNPDSNQDEQMDKAKEILNSMF
ncbi:S41 family peptidase [Eubacteriales bacterium KG125]